MADTATIKVVVLDGHMVVDGDGRYMPGDTVAVTPAEAERLQSLGCVDRVKDGAGEMAGGMTVAELKRELESLKVEYPPDARKADLVALYRTATNSDEG